MKRLMILAIPLLSGCIVVAAAVLAGVVIAGTYTYVNGEGTQDYEVTVHQAYEATVKVCEKNKLAVGEKNEDSFNARVVAKLADGTEVKFNMQKLADKKTRLAIRVGTLGDEYKTKDLHSQIATELGETNKQ